METKIFGLALLITVFLTVIVSAGTNFEVSSHTLTLTKSVNQTSFTITNKNTTNITVIIPEFSIVDRNDNIISLTQTVEGATSTGVNEYNITPGATATVTISHSLTDSEKEKLPLGTFSDSIEIKDVDNNETELITLNFVSSFCKYGEKGSLEIRKFNIDNLGEGDDDKWQPLDEIEIEVRVKNTDEDEEVEDILLEIKILDSNYKDVTEDFDFDEEEIDIGDLDERETSDSVFFKIKELPAEVEDGIYRIYIKAYSDEMEEEQCVWTSDDLNVDNQYEEIEVERKEKRAVIAKNYPLTFEVEPQDVLDISFDIYNIGKYDEDDVLVTVENLDLGIKEREHVRNLDIGEKEELNFNIKIPENIEAGKIYYLNIYTYFDYDDGDVFEEDSYDKDSLNDLDEYYRIRIKSKEAVEVKETKPSASITAELDSEAVEGKQLVVKGTITNTGEKRTTYFLFVSGYGSWASLNEIDPQTVTLDPDDSKDFYIYFNVNKNVAGEQFFTIKANYDEQTTEQDVAVVIEKAPSFTFRGITGEAIAENLRENWFIWVIVIVNIILIIAIIVVAKRIAASS